MCRFIEILKKESPRPRILNSVNTGIKILMSALMRLTARLLTAYIGLLPSSLSLMTFRMRPVISEGYLSIPLQSISRLGTRSR